MKITLDSLRLINFQGERDKSVTFGAKNFIYGRNEAGKSRLFNAFSWLLFDKDSLSRKDFAIKTLDTNNEPVHFLEHAVEGTLNVDGSPIVLKKVYSEKWTKKRGSAKDEFSGHTTDYFVDGVPVKLAEFKARIAQIINEETFKLLTDANYFNGVLEWKDRRRILIEVAGDVTDADVIASDEALAALPEILGKRSIDDHRKVLAAKRKEINEQLEKIPVRIDEAERSKPATKGNEKEIVSQIKELRTAIIQKEDELSRLKNGGEVAEQQKRMREIEGELIALENSLQAEILKSITAQREKTSSIAAQVSDVERQIKTLSTDIAEAGQKITKKEAQKESLRDKWFVIDAETMPETHGDDVCVACGQALPIEQVQAAHDKALAAFNVSKYERLEWNQSEGKQLAAEIKALKDQSEKSQSATATLTVALENAKSAHEQAAKDLSALQAQLSLTKEDLAYMAKQAELDIVKQKIAALQQSSKTETDRVELDILDLRNELRVIEQQYAAFGQVIVLNTRIKELKAEEKKLSAEYERLQAELYLTEQFIVAKVNMLESKINSKFKHARFKLFEQQINGGISEMCETLYNGVPYSKGLNHGMQILVGLDIIDTLQAHYGVHAPCWVDNAEAVTQEIKTDSQLIALYASGRDKVLSVESVYRTPDNSPERDYYGPPEDRWPDYADEIEEGVM